MKKITFIIAVAIFAVACRSNPPTYDVTFEIRTVFNDVESLPDIAIVGIFRNLDFDLDSSRVSFPSEMTIETQRGFETVSPRRIAGWDTLGFFDIAGLYSNTLDRIVVQNVSRGYNFIAVLILSISHNAILRGYRIIYVNEHIENEVQRFVFDETDTFFGAFVPR